jgi:hypothetical protein
LLQRVRVVLRVDGNDNVPEWRRRAAADDDTHVERRRRRRCGI